MGKEGNIKPKQYLLDCLKINKDELTYYLIDYLRCLINLEFSITKPYINERERQILKRTSIYNEIMAYNLYHRIQYLLTKDGLPITITGNNQTYAIYSDYRFCKLFEFYHGTNKTYKLSYNHISIHEYIETLTTKDEILAYLSELMEKIKNETNPYPEHIMKYTASLWEDIHKQLIENYEDAYQQVLDRTPRYGDFAIMALSSEISRIILDEFCLTKADFTEVAPRILTDDYHINTIQMKKLPNIEIRRHLNYF